MIPLIAQSQKLRCREVAKFLNIMLINLPNTTQAKLVRSGFIHKCFYQRPHFQVLMTDIRVYEYRLEEVPAITDNLQGTRNVGVSCQEQGLMVTVEQGRRQRGQGVPDSLQLLFNSLFTTIPQVNIRTFQIKKTRL